MLDGVNHTRLVKFVARIVGVYDAEDVVQNTYVEVLTRGAFHGASSYDTWVTSIAKQRALNWVRDRGRDRHAERMAASGDTYQPDLDAWLDDRRTWARLTADDQALLTAIHSAPSVADAATTLGLTLDVVKHRLAAARRRLKELTDDL